MIFKCTPILTHIYLQSDIPLYEPKLSCICIRICIHTVIVISMYTYSYILTKWDTNVRP
jgi:hypothetical protein